MASSASKGVVTCSTPLNAWPAGAQIAGRFRRKQWLANWLANRLANQAAVATTVANQMLATAVAHRQVGGQYQYGVDGAERVVGLICPAKDADTPLGWPRWFHRRPGARWPLARTPGQRVALVQGRTHCWHRVRLPTVSSMITSRPRGWLSHFAATMPHQYGW